MSRAPSHTQPPRTPDRPGQSCPLSFRGAAASARAALPSSPPTRGRHLGCACLRAPLATGRLNPHPPPSPAKRAPGGVFHTPAFRGTPKLRPAPEAQLPSSGVGLGAAARGRLRLAGTRAAAAHSAPRPDAHPRPDAPGLLGRTGRVTLCRREVAGRAGGCGPRLEARGTGGRTVSPVVAAAGPWRRGLPGPAGLVGKMRSPGSAAVLSGCGSATRRGGCAKSARPREGPGEPRNAVHRPACSARGLRGVPTTPGDAQWNPTGAGERGRSATGGEGPPGP